MSEETKWAKEGGVVLNALVEHIRELEKRVNAAELALRNHTELIGSLTDSLIRESEGRCRSVERLATDINCLSRNLSRQISDVEYDVRSGRI